MPGSEKTTAGKAVKTVAGAVVNATGPTVLSLAAEGAGHYVINAGAVAAGTVWSLVSNYMVGPAAWWLLSSVAQGTTFVVKKTGNGIYHLFVPGQTTPVLTIEDKKARP